MTEDEVVGWHHCLNGHEFEQALGGSERQGNLVCFEGVTESDVTWQLNNNQIVSHYGSKSEVFQDKKGSVLHNLLINNFDWCCRQKASFG